MDAKEEMRGNEAKRGKKRRMNERVSVSSSEESTEVVLVEGEKEKEKKEENKESEKGMKENVTNVNKDEKI